MTGSAVLAALAGALLLAAGPGEVLQVDAKTARATVQGMRVNGQAGGSFDFRVRATDRSYNYKLRATWLTPDVIRATARLVQLSDNLGDDKTRELIAEGERAGDTVILVEIDPREGSGVIPRDWTALLGPRGAEPGGPRVTRGTPAPQLRERRALAGVGQRDYAYDAFWVTFPLRTPDGQALFQERDQEAELIVRIYDKIGRVRWPLPDSIRHWRPERAAVP